MNIMPDITAAVFSNWDVVSPGVTLSEVSLPSEVNSKLPFNIAEFHVEPGGATTLESHAVRELWYVLDGQGRMPGTEVDRVIVRGDLLFMESQVPHSVVNDGPLAFKALAIWW